MSIIKCDSLSVLISRLKHWNDRFLCQLDQYEATIGSLQAIVNAYVGCSVVLGRDWNVSKMVTTLLNPTFHNFARIIICVGWISQIDSVNFTYHCDANNHFSLVDRFTCSSYLVDNTHKMQIFTDGHNTSDHFAISLEVKMLSCSSNPQPKQL